MRILGLLIFLAIGVLVREGVYGPADWSDPLVYATIVLWPYVILFYAAIWTVLVLVVGGILFYTWGKIEKVLYNSKWYRSHLRNRIRKRIKK